MESADQHEARLVQGIKGANQPEAQKPIPLTDELKQVGVDATHIVGSTVGELMGGEGGSSRVRTVESKELSSISRIREGLKRRLWK